MRGRWVSSGVLGALAACADPTVVLAPPALDPLARSILVIREAPDARALELYDAAALPLLRASDDELLRLSFLQYPWAPAERELPLGPQELTDDRACAAWRVEAPLRLDTVDLREPDEGLRPVSTLPSALAALALARPCPCKEREFEVIPLGPGVVQGVLHLDDGRWIVMTSAGVHVYGADLVRTASVARPAAALISMIRLDDGRIRAVDVAGAVKDLSLDELRWTPFGGARVDAVIEADGARDGSELVVTAEDGSVHLVTTATSVMLRGPEEVSGTSQLGSAAWVPPEGFVVAPRRGVGFFERAERGAALERVEWPSGLYPIARLVNLDGLGLMLLTRVNTVHWRRPREAELVELPAADEHLAAIRGVARVGAGFVVAGENGVREWYPSSGYCPVTRLSEPGYGTELRPIDAAGEVIVAGGMSTDAVARLFVFRPR